MLKRFRFIQLRPFARGLAAAAATAMLLPAPWSFAAGPELVIPARDAVADRTQEMWSARWWMWAASFQDGPGPVRDLTGTLCGEGQEGEVFFLAGTYERRPIARTCKVPAGKYLFFPLVNYVVWPQSGAGPCEAYKSTAREMTDEPIALFAELDGKALPDLEKRRLAPDECFNMNAKSGGPRVLAASNGYWLMLKPLPRGKHTLHFGGMLPSLRQDVTYTLIVG